MNSDERERLRQIRERWNRMNMPQTVFTTHCKGDIDFLLSLIESQKYEVNEVDAERLADYHKIGGMPAIVKSVDYGATTLAECVEKTVDRFHEMGRKEGARTTTAMRDKCVEKVKELLRGSLNPDHQAAYNTVIHILKSLTLDQVEEQ